MKKFLLSLLFLFVALSGVFGDTRLSPTSRKEISSNSTSITIRCNVSNADVYINRRYQGKSDITIKDLAPGFYDLKVSKSGYESAYYRIQVKSGYSLNYDVKLTLITGTISITNMPYGGELYVNGSRHYSDRVDVEPGNYEVEVKKFGYETVYADVDVYPRKNSKVNVYLEKAEFRLTNFRASRDRINPNHSGGLGKVEFAFTVSAEGSAVLKVLDSYDQEIWRANFNNFTTWENKAVWDGKDAFGRALPDGVYTAVIEAGPYNYNTRVTVDGNMNYAMVTPTASGGGVGTLPAAYHTDVNFIMPYFSFEPLVRVQDMINPLAPSPLKLGMILGLGTWGEFDFDFAGYIPQTSEKLGVSTNFVFRGTFEWSGQDNSYTGLTLLARYGYSSVENDELKGFDKGAGLGFGMVLGRDSRKSYFGASTEFVLGPESGILDSSEFVMKSGLALELKPSAGLNLGLWTALHSAFGKYDGQPYYRFYWDRGIEGGVELKLTPGLSSALMNFQLKAIYSPYTNVIYAGGKFGLSYLF